MRSLEPSQKEHGLLAGYIIGIAVGECIVFALSSGAYAACVNGLRGQGPMGSFVGMEEIGEWQDVERPARRAECSVEKHAGSVCTILCRDFRQTIFGVGKRDT